jgi:hypothetical protein
VVTNLASFCAAAVVQEYAGNYPSQVSVVSFGSKQQRFELRNALRVDHKDAMKRE